MCADAIVKRDNLPIAVFEEDKAPHYVFESGQITKKGCKLCQFQHRALVEETFDAQKRKNYSDLQKQMQTDFNFEISVPAIRNHMIYHYGQTRRNVGLTEYAEDLQAWVGKQKNQKLAVRSRIAILEREMVTLAEMSDDLDIAERRRNAETIKKLAETIMSYESKLAEITEQMKPVAVIFQQIQLIIKDEIQHANSITVRKAFTNFVSRLNESVGEMALED